MWVYPLISFLGRNFPTFHLGFMERKLNKEEHPNFTERKPYPPEMLTFSLMYN
jgi:hypothetical protein